jgi:DNA polymerase
VEQQRRGPHEYEVTVSKDAHESTAEVTAIREEARRHLEWLRESGLRELEAPAAAAPSRDRGRQAVEGRARERVPGLSPSPPGGERAGVRAPPRYALSDKGCGSDALLGIREELGECTRCKLAGGRTKLVFGVGDPAAQLMFVGEGPGADEDVQGEPFVGKAGQLLTKMIEAMGFRREEVYIANVVKCRPPGNRDPEPDEIAACEPYLKAQIAAVGPKVVVALGRFAVQTLLRDPTPISRQRGRWRAYEGVKLMPTFHPAYLLRNPPEKKKAWEDLQLVMKELGKAPAAR